MKSWLIGAIPTPRLVILSKRNLIGIDILRFIQKITISAGLVPARTYTDII